MSEYWVELRHDGRRLGAGFFLTRRFLLTADHCLRGVPDGETDIEFVLADGTTIAAKVYERQCDVDLALIRVLGEVDVALLQAERCYSHDVWRVPSRPEPNDPHLEGVVTDPKVFYKCEGGTILEALQLRTNVELGDYSGYSGGPVERVTKERGLAGVLLEQYPDRQTPERATNTLFAATVAEVMARFDCLDMSNLMGVAFGPPPTELRDLLYNATELLKQGAEWEAQGLLNPTEVTAMRLRVARSVVDQTFARRTR